MTRSTDIILNDGKNGLDCVSATLKQHWGRWGYIFCLEVLQTWTHIYQVFSFNFLHDAWGWFWGAWVIQEASETYFSKERDQSQKKGVTLLFYDTLSHKVVVLLFFVVLDNGKFWNAKNGTNLCVGFMWTGK